MIPIWYRAEESATLAAFVARGIPGCERGWDDVVALGVFDAERLRAAVLYHDWSPERGTISMSAYSDSARWLTSRVLWEIFDYPFNRVGCQMVLMQVSASNRRMLSIAKRFGFEMIRVPRGRGRNEDEILCTLTDDAWRKNKYARRYVQAQSSKAA